MVKGVSYSFLHFHTECVYVVVRPTCCCGSHDDTPAPSYSLSPSLSSSLKNRIESLPVCLANCTIPPTTPRFDLRKYEHL